MENNLKTIVYLTTNIVNKKIYIGIHNTTNPDTFDGYIGCGININSPKSIWHPTCPFQYAVKKYGFDKFIRNTIKVCNTREEAIELEKMLVDKAFISRTDTYNIALGGGDPPRSDKEVYQYDINGNYINKYNSITEAEIKVLKASGISNAIKYKTLSGGYLWSDIFYEKLDITKYFITIQKKSVYLYNKEGDLYKQYNSLSEVMKELKVTLGPIQRAIITKTKIKGYYISDKYIEKFIPVKYVKHTKGVYQYDLGGNFIQEFKSCLEVERQLGKVYHQIPTKIRLGKPCGDYLWSWDKFDKIKPYIKPILPRKVGQYTLDGELIKVYNTVRDCRKDFGNVSRVLKGLVNQCKGYTFKYIN